MGSYNKEAFKLLDLSGSDSASDKLEFTAAPTRVRKKVRMKKKARNNPTPSHNTGCGKPAILFLGAVTLLGGVGTLAWFSINMHLQVDKLIKELNNIQGSNDGVTEALQSYHTNLQQLQKNYTQMKEVQQEILDNLNNLTSQVTAVTKQLNQQQSALSTAPELSNIPRRMGDVEKSVAGFGSNLNNLNVKLENIESELNDFKNKDKILQKLQEEFKEKLMQLETTVLLQNQSSTAVPGGFELKLNHITDDVNNISIALPKIQQDIQFSMESLNNHSITLAMIEEADSKMVEDINNVTSNVSNLEEICANYPSINETLLNLTKITENLQLKVDKLYETGNSEVLTSSSTPKGTARGREGTTEDLNLSDSMLNGNSTSA